MRDTLTSLLDFLAVLLLAAGVGFLATGWPVVLALGLHTWGFGIGMTGVGFTASGLVVLFSSLFVSRPAPIDEPPTTGEVYQ